MTPSPHSFSKVWPRVPKWTLGSYATAWAFGKRCPALELESTLSDPSFSPAQQRKNLYDICLPHTYCTNHHTPCPFPQQSNLKLLLYFRHRAWGWDTTMRDSDKALYLEGKDRKKNSLDNRWSLKLQNRAEMGVGPSAVVIFEQVPTKGMPVERELQAKGQHE